MAWVILRTQPNRRATHKENAMASDKRATKLGFLYIFGTNLENIYKLGFTETSLKGRSLTHSYKLGSVKVEAVIMTVDARQLEATLFDEAMKVCDRVKTLTTRKHFGATELFYLLPDSVAQVKQYLVELGQSPFHVEHVDDLKKSSAIALAVRFNSNLADGQCDVQSLDRALKRMNLMISKVSIGKDLPTFFHST